MWAGIHSEDQATGLGWAGTRPEVHGTDLGWDGTHVQEASPLVEMPISVDWTGLQGKATITVAQTTLLAHQ